MAVDRDYLQAQITTLRMLADAAERVGDTEAAATYLRLRAQQMDRLRELEERLQRREQPRTVNKMDSNAHAFATSQGRSGDALVRAANKAKLTLRALAAAAGVSPSNLSMARRGERPIPRSAAEKVAALTGFAATASNWRGGISEGK